MKTKQKTIDKDEISFSDLNVFDYFTVKDNIYVKLPIVNNLQLGIINAYDLSNDCLTCFKDIDVKKVACELRWWGI